MTCKRNIYSDTVRMRRSENMTRHQKQYEVLYCTVDKGRAEIDQGSAQRSMHKVCAQYCRRKILEGKTSPRFITEATVYCTVVISLITQHSELPLIEGVNEQGLYSS